MGKRRSKAGLSGLSQFVAVLHQDQTQTQTQPAPRPLTVQKLDQDNSSGVEHREDECGESVEMSSAGFRAIQTEISITASRYDMTGLVPFFSEISQVPEHLKKCMFGPHSLPLWSSLLNILVDLSDFSQRTRFFSLYDKPPGCLLDEEGWYSVTPERVANQVAERCRCNVILDAFCGVGGNAIAFAKTCERGLLSSFSSVIVSHVLVIALDINPTRLALARHNAQIYGVSDRIEFIQADYISFARAYFSTPSPPSPSDSPSNKRRKIDTVFLSPPWGGPSYLAGSQLPLDDGEAENTGTNSHPTYSLSSIQPIHGRDLFVLTRKITPNIAYYLPRNTDVSEIGKLLDGVDDTGNPIRREGEEVEVEEEWMGSKLKALTCYFGGLAAGQDHLF